MPVSATQSRNMRRVVRLFLSILCLIVIAVAVYGARDQYGPILHRTGLSVANDADKKEKSSQDKKKDDKSSKSKKQDDDDDDDDDDDVDDAKKESSDKNDQSKSKAKDTPAGGGESDRAVESSVDSTQAQPQTPAKGVFADAKYINVAEAVKRARAEGGSGDVVQIDLEWDEARSVPSWDVTFSSGNEYELDALSGKLLGTKPKSPAKLAELSPLSVGEPSKKLLSFQDIIRKAASQGRTVMEMELKHAKGKSAPVYEIVLSDGATAFYDAATGATVSGV